MNKNDPVIITRDNKGRFKQHIPHECPGRDVFSDVLITATGALLGIAVHEGFKKLYSTIFKTKKKKSYKHDDIKRETASPRSYAAKRAHFTRKINNITNNFQILSKKKTPEEIIQLLQSIVIGLEELEEYAFKLDAQNVYLHVDNNAWNSFIDMKKKVEESCRFLKGQLLKKKIHNFPRYNKPEIEGSLHRTLIEIKIVRTQLEHSFQLAEWLQKSSVPLNSKSMVNSGNLLESNENKTTI
ncbi:MAG: hypothetical protein ACFFDN_35815 [Candidatus Hodarchaeota archaeon]